MTEEDKWEVINFRKDVPKNMGVVIKEAIDSKKLVQHGDLCRINLSTGNGNLINTRCVGASVCNSSRVFVVWREGSNLQIREYSGLPIFPEYF